MPKLIVTLEGRPIKELTLIQEKTTLGRRSHNDFVFEHLSISGEHAVFIRSGDEYRIEDANSTNGVYVNGQRVQHKTLKHGDTLDLGQYRLQFLEPTETPFDKTMVFRAPTAGGKAGAHPAGGDKAGAGRAFVRELAGSAVVREVELVKTVTAFGKLGLSVASIVRRTDGYTVAMVEGKTAPTLNAQPLTDEPQVLHDGDILDLAGTRLQFVMA